MHILGKFLAAEEAKYKLDLERKNKRKKKEKEEAQKQKRLQAEKRKRQKERQKKRRKVKRAKRAALLTERGWTYRKATLGGRSVLLKQMKPKYADTKRMIIALLGKGKAVEFIANPVRKREKCLKSTAIQRVIDIKFKVITPNPLNTSE